MFLRVTLIILLAVSCYTQDYMTCSRNTDTFQLPSTLPAPPGGVNQQGKPGKQGPVGLTGPIGPKGMKGEPGIPDDSEIDVLRDRLRVSEQKLNNTLATLISLHSGWYWPLNGYLYKLTTTTQSWQESRSLCQGMGGDLAAVGMRDIDLRINIVSALRISAYTWIGLNDLSNEGVFVWIDGVASTSGNTNWNTYEPSNGGGRNEDCVELRPHHTSSDQRYIVTNDRPCDFHAQALCEKRIEI